jgi:hypothetical protein
MRELIQCCDKYQMARYLIHLQKSSVVKLVISILVIVLFVTDISGQVDTLKEKNDTIPQRSYLIQKVNRDGVTMPEVEIKEVKIVGRPSRVQRNEYRQYERLVYNIKRVYPYAIIVRLRLNQVNDELKNIPDEKSRKEYMRSVEKEVVAQYEDDMRQMTITQGRLLIKLIDRETQNTSYTLIRDYRGKFSAAFWQGIARIFGTNLKEQYDPSGEDALIELIIHELDEGRL